MAAAAYYQQLSLSLGGTSNPGMSPAHGFPFKEYQNPSQIAAALATNPYLFQSLASPPSSANGAPNPITPASMHRYIPQESPYMNNSLNSYSLPYNFHNHINSQHEMFPSTVKIQHGLPSHADLRERISDTFQAAIRNQRTTNGNSFLPIDYTNLPTSCQENQLHNIKRGNSNSNVMFHL